MFEQFLETYSFLLIQASAASRVRKARRRPDQPPVKPSTLLVTIRLHECGLFNQRIIGRAAKPQDPEIPLVESGE